MFATSTVQGLEYEKKQLKHAINVNIPSLLIGPTGAGKTTIIHWLAKEHGKKLVSIPLHGQIGREELIGKWLLKDGATYWQDGILSQAIKENSWVLFDEINAALPEVLFILHSLLDHQRRITLPEKDNEVLEAGPEFRFFATMNPTEDYVGTKTLNLAFMSRFGVVLHFDYLDYRAEALVIADVLGNSGITVKKESCEAVSLIGAAIRELYKKKQVFYPCSTRDLIYAAALLHDGAEMDEAINSAIINKLSNEERVVVSQTITVVVKYLEDQKGVSMSIMTALKDADQLRKEYDKLKIAVKNLQSLKNGLTEGIKQIDV